MRAESGRIAPTSRVANEPQGQWLSGSRAATGKHWHIDISYINIAGTFYYLSAVLDGYSRYIVHWEIREQMLEQDIEIALERARERCPKVRPRIISDNGPQFIAKDFKEYIRIRQVWLACANFAVLPAE
ncbi:MAG: DDE-type integrase/transposase/recombinase [Methylococcales bacterium]